MPKKQRRLRYPKIKRLVITIEARESSDGSDVELDVDGKIATRIFEDGEDNWTQLKGIAHHLIREMGGLTRYGRKVTIVSEP